MMAYRTFFSKKKKSCISEIFSIYVNGQWDVNEQHHQLIKM